MGLRGWGVGEGGGGEGRRGRGEEGLVVVVGGDGEGCESGRFINGD